MNKRIRKKLTNKTDVSTLDYYINIRYRGGMINKPRCLQLKVAAKEKVEKMTNEAMDECKMYADNYRCLGAAIKKYYKKQNIRIPIVNKKDIPVMSKEELDEWAHKLKVHELPVFTPYLVEHTEFIEGCIEPEFHDNKLTGFSLCKPINVGNRIGDVIRGHRLTDRESEDSAYAESMKHYTFDGTVYDRKDDENEQ